MPFRLKIAARYLFSNRGQSVLLLTGVAIGVLVFCFMSALINGLAQYQINQTVGAIPHLTFEPRETDRMAAGEFIHNQKTQIMGGCGVALAGVTQTGHQEHGPLLLLGLVVGAFFFLLALLDDFGLSRSGSRFRRSFFLDANHVSDHSIGGGKNADPFGNLQIRHAERVTDEEFHNIHVERFGDGIRETFDFDLTRDHVEHAALGLDALGLARDVHRNRNSQLAVHGDALRAAVEAGTARIRPVLMTAAAMIIGMLPMATANSQNAPLGRAVMGGLFVATLFTLFFVPCVYAIIYHRRTVPQKESV